MLTVLIVDDEKMIREGLRRILTSRGYRVLTAESGREALDIIRAEEIHVVLCDLKMPVMGAIGVLDVVGTAYPGLPVIVFTGHGTSQDASECVSRGAYEFITKPFRPDYLLSVIKCAVEKLPPPPRLSEIPF
ncbi:MAG: response regulator [Syntrophobacteraceae bacterium]